MGDEVGYGSEEKMNEDSVHEMSQNGTKKDYISGKSVRKIGVTAFWVIAAVVVLVFAFVRSDSVLSLLKKIGSALAPVFVGAVLAYIMNPFMTLIDTRLRYILTKRGKHIRGKQKFARGVSVFITIVFFMLLVAFLVYLLVPELASTVRSIIPQLPDQAERLEAWFHTTILEDTLLGKTLKTLFDKGTEYVQNFTENGLISAATGLLGSLASGVWNVFGVLYNVIIGLIFSIYLLLAKEDMLALAKKLVYALFSLKRANKIVRLSGQCHRKFIDSITGKIIDSIIVGVLCFVVMVILRFPYAALISVIVGITNVIPFFGPYLGAVPSALLILFVDPLQCLWFVVWIIVLQQIDCNILTPRIVGESIGLSPFWVLFACIVFGSLFGILGLLLGVPFMGCIYMIIKEEIDAKLQKKGLETDSAYYADIKKIDEIER